MPRLSRLSHSQRSECSVSQRLITRRVSLPLILIAMDCRRPSLLGCVNLAPLTPPILLPAFVQQPLLISRRPAEEGHPHPARAQGHHHLRHARHQKVCRLLPGKCHSQTTKCLTRVPTSSHVSQIIKCPTRVPSSQPFTSISDNEVSRQNLNCSPQVSQKKCLIRVPPSPQGSQIVSHFSHLQAPMVRIPGKMFPVALEYVPVGGSGRCGPMSARADKTDAYVGRGLARFLLSCPTLF